MIEYDLYSNNLAEISLLYSEHLLAETLYHEQMHRWSRQYGRPWGIVQTGEDDLQVYGSATDYEVSLRYCKAITPHGYLVDLDGGAPPLTLQGSNDRHRDSLVPLYLGVALEKQEANVGVSQTGALLDRPVLRWQYRLAVEPESARFDWMQVGRMRKEGASFVRDDRYIPQCVHLRSCSALYRIAAEITESARGAMTALEQAAKLRSDGSDVSTAWLALVGVMINALAPATVLIDWDVHPRQYLERLALALRTYASLLPLLEATNSNWTDANDRIQHALKSLGDAGNPAGSGPSAFSSTLPRSEALSIHGANALHPEMTRPGTYWWDVFDLIRQAFKALSVLFRGLSPTTTGTSAPQMPMDTGGTVIRRQPTPFQPVKKT